VESGEWRVKRRREESEEEKCKEEKRERSTTSIKSLIAVLCGTRKLLFYSHVTLSSCDHQFQASVTVQKSLLPWPGEFCCTSTVKKRMAGYQQYSPGYERT
jgi:hypothetical protein